MAANTQIKFPFKAPDHEEAAVLLRCMASELFRHIHEPGADRASILTAWTALKRSAQLLTERGAPELTLAEAFALREALKLCERGEQWEWMMALDFEIPKPESAARL